MTTGAQWQPARLPRPQAGAEGGRAERPRRFVSFAFYALDPAWLRLDAAARQAGAQELAAVIEGCREHLLVHSYTTFGVRAETDFLLWRVSDTLDDFEAMAAAMRRTAMGRCLQTPYSFLAMTDAEASRPRTPGEAVIGGRCLLVCPLVRTDAWDALPEEERRGMAREVLHLGRQAPGPGWDAIYSVGLGGGDGVLTFEADRPEAFLGLGEALRGTRAAQYTRRDTPTFIGTRQEPAAILARIGGVPHV